MDRKTRFVNVSTVSDARDLTVYKANADGLELFRVSLNVYGTLEEANKI